MKLRSVTEVLPETKVILKLDLDVPITDEVITDNSRLVKSLPTIKLLLEKKCKIAVVGKLGRPEGHDPKLSLRPVYLELMSLLDPNGDELFESIFVEDIGNFEKLDTALSNNQIVVLENLRFWKGEENNDPEFLKNLTEICQCFVNDALAVSHRKERSNMLHKEMPAFYGLAFIEEIEKMTEIIENPKRPLVVILGGAKEDKLNYLGRLADIADTVLIGGKLPTYIPKGVRMRPNTIPAHLRDDKYDLSDEDIKMFITKINWAKSIVWAGAMGWFEKDDCKKGTEEIAKAIANSDAYKIIAGGDTGASIINLGLKDKIDYICSGGGVMLEFLTKGELVAWEN